MRNHFIQLPTDAKITTSPVPLKANIITNYACNLNCTYCDVDHLAKSMLSTDEILLLMDEFASMGMQQVNFIGGEPTLRKDLGVILKYAKSLDLVVVIHSNGNFVRSPEPEMLHNIDVFVTCINGSPDIHEKSRGKGTFALTLSSISLMHEYEVLVVVDMILSSDNCFIEEVEYMLLLAREHNFRINFQPVFEHGLVAADQQLIGGLKLRDEQIRKIFSYLVQKYEPDIIFNSLQYLQNVAEQNINRFEKCFMGHYSLTVDPFGRVARCFKYVQNIENPNGRQLGWKKAANQVEITDCLTCPYSNHAEDNLFLEAAFKEVVT